jgi:hypothetical protein
MRDLVCIRKIRPPTSTRWQNHSVKFLAKKTNRRHLIGYFFLIKILRPIINLCEELWIEDPTCRLNSLNIKKKLKQLELLENDLSNINIESQQQSTPNDGPWTA